MCALTNNDSWVLHFNKDLLTSTDVRERTQALEAELAQTSAQLQQLQALQASLRTKNQLLEKLRHLNKQADFKSFPELPQNRAVSFSMHSILQTHFDTILQLVLLKAVFTKTPSCNLGVQVTTRKSLCQTELLEGR